MRLRAGQSSPSGRLYLVAKAFMLVQDDTATQVKATIYRERNVPADLTGATVRMYFRKKRTKELIGTLLNRSNAEQKLKGEAIFLFEVEHLDGEKGMYEGEVEVTYLDGGIETVYNIIDFYLREDF